MHWPLPPRTDQIHTTGWKGALQENERSERVRVTRQVSLEEVGLELALEGLLEGDARQGNIRGKDGDSSEAIPAFLSPPASVSPKLDLL